MIIAVDYDGTLLVDNSINLPLIRRLITAQRQGHVIILWTCRSGHRLADAVKTMRKYGLKPNYVNCNTPEMIRKLGYDPRKILADVYIDDKAVK